MSRPAIIHYVMGTVLIVLTLLFLASRAEAEDFRLVGEYQPQHEEPYVGESPDVQLVKLETYKVVIDPGGIFNSAKLYVNNENKQFRVNRHGNIVFRSEFPIHYVRVTVTNDYGRTIREYRRYDREIY